MPGQAIGKFQILGKLGAGAHSSILHVRCSNDGKQYALKVVDIASPEDHKFLDQARHEFRVAQMLEHPNLIKIHALEIKRDWLFRIRKVHLLTEYVNGKTLDTLPAMSIPRLVQLFAKVASALVHMHRRGVYHADLKPNNIMLSRTGTVKILDYGLSWIKGEDKGRVQGTPEYMAPEQVRKSMANEKTDLYNFGATMYRLVTWRLPPSTMASTGSRSLDVQSFEEKLKPVEELNPKAPKALCDLIHQCLSFQPLRRPERAMDVKDSLELLLAKLAPSPEESLEAMEW